jgi:hypothetical protein
MHPRGDMIIKKYKIIINGQKLKEEELTTEIHIDLLGPGIGNTYEDRKRTTGSVF